MVPSDEPSPAPLASTIKQVCDEYLERERDVFLDRDFCGNLTLVIVIVDLNLFFLNLSMDISKTYIVTRTRIHESKRARKQWYPKFNTFHNPKF